MKEWKVQDRRMWNPEIGVWTAYIKTGDNVITIPVIAEDEQEAIDRAGQIVKCVNSYEAMREALGELRLIIRRDGMQMNRGSAVLLIDKALKESE